MEFRSFVLLYALVVQSRVHNTYKVIVFSQLVFGVWAGPIDPLAPSLQAHRLPAVTTLRVPIHVYGVPIHVC
jgi:hypothetical protein